MYNACTPKPTKYWLEKVKELHKWRDIDHVCGLEDLILKCQCPLNLYILINITEGFFFLIGKMILNEY